MTNDSVITKADLLKTHKVGNRNLRGQEVLKTNAQRRNTANLYTQDYTGVNPVIGNINTAQGAGTKMK